MDAQTVTFLRGSQVYGGAGRSGLGRSAIYAQIAEGLFPPPVPLGRRAVGFISAEVDAWLRARAAGKRDAELRELVSKLKAERAQLAP